MLLPGADGELAGVVLGLGEARGTIPWTGPSWRSGSLRRLLPPGLYHLAERDRRCRAGGRRLGARRLPLPPLQVGHNGGDAVAQLKVPRGADLRAGPGDGRGVWLGRDLINTPASDMGPQELEEATRMLAKRHGARSPASSATTCWPTNFPMIHAVGRASDRRAAADRSHLGQGRSARRVTLVGKGICFDTGGLDIKPASAMLIMKKDMGGAAAALALAHMVMAAKLDVRLRVLIPAAENSISGNAFRPGDVLMSRAGKTVEIGNTDAEGRLVLADALSLADEERPDMLVSFATLTGAARVALGPELPPLYTDDDAFAGGDCRSRQPRRRSRVAHAVLDRLRGDLDSPVADMNNVSDGPFAGLGHGGAVPAPVRQAGPALCAFRHLRLAAGGQAARAQGRRGAGRARAVRGTARQRAPLRKQGAP